MPTEFFFSMALDLNFDLQLIWSSLGFDFHISYLKLEDDPISVALKWLKPTNLISRYLWPLVAQWIWTEVVGAAAKKLMNRTQHHNLMRLQIALWQILVYVLCLLFFFQKCQCNELCAIKIRSVQHKVHGPCISPMRFAKHGGARRRYDDKYMRVTNMSSQWKPTSTCFKNDDESTSDAWFNDIYWYDTITII